MKNHSCTLILYPADQMRSRTTTTQRSAVGRLICWKLAFLLLVLACLFYAFGSGDKSLDQLRRKWRELEIAEERVARLQAVNDSLTQVLWRLENDLEYVEKVAREDYGMVKEGEQIYRLRSSTTKDTTQ